MERYVKPLVYILIENKLFSLFLHAYPHIFTQDTINLENMHIYFLKKLL